MKTLHLTLQDHESYYHQHLHPTTSGNDLAIEKGWHTIMHFKSWVMVQSIARVLGCWLERLHNNFKHLTFVANVTLIDLKMLKSLGLFVEMMTK
jgi:hypothetical protein